MITPIANLLKETYTLTHKTVSGKDAFGNPIKTETTTDITNCHLQPNTATMGNNGCIYSARLYTTSPTTAQDDDIITAKGKKYWINSVVEHHHPATDHGHITIELRETLERKVVV